MPGWPLHRWHVWFQKHHKSDPWEFFETAGDRTTRDRQGGGAREDRLRHRWRLLEIAEKTGRSVEEVRVQLGLTSMA